MKTFRKIGLILSWGLLGVLFLSCAKESNNSFEQSEYVTVNLSMGGEFVQFSESPLGTRAVNDTSDLIAICVYMLDGDTETKFAYGVFNSLSDLSIKLLSGHKYKFVATIIVDGHKCAKHNGNCLGFGYNPETEFKYTSNFEIFNVYSINTITNGVFEHDRFYGELTGYTPETGGTVTIDTKRVAYGSHYVVEGLTDGYLDITVSESLYDYYVYSLKVTSEEPEVDLIYSFPDFTAAWNGIYDADMGGYVDYYNNFKLTIGWVKSDGTTIPVGNYDVVFKRNVKTTIRIKLEDLSETKGIVIIRQDDVLTEDADEYLITEGQIVTVPVTQQ